MSNINPSGRTTTPNKLVIEIISDIVCPWCWVGKRKLELALKTCDGIIKPIIDDDNVEIIWKPYQLRPNTPSEGILKPPNTPDNPRAGPRLKAAGATVGIDFTGKTDRTPNTLLSHVLLDYALEEYGWEKQNEVQEAIFQAYFTDGIFPNENNLASIGESCGLLLVNNNNSNNKTTKEEFIKSVLNDKERLKSVQTEINENYSKVHGQGVPFFIFNGTPVFSGAQDPSKFHEEFDMIL